MLDEQKSDPRAMRFRPVRSVRLSEEIINQIARLVNEGHIKLNERFPSERDLDLNGDFHRSIARAAGNPLLEEMLERLLVESGRVGFKDIVGVEDWATLQGEHQPVFDAIRDRDPERARLAMIRHFDNLRERIT